DDRCTQRQKTVLGLGAREAKEVHLAVAEPDAERLTFAHRPACTFAFTSGQLGSRQSLVPAFVQEGHRLDPGYPRGRGNYRVQAFAYERRFERADRDRVKSLGGDR